MDGVAAEVAEEIRMLLEDADVAAGASEQKARHYTCGSAPRDYEITISL